MIGGGNITTESKNPNQNRVMKYNWYKIQYPIVPIFMYQHPRIFQDRLQIYQGRDVVSFFRELIFNFEKNFGSDKEY